jgi:hypothetical protein
MDNIFITKNSPTKENKINVFADSFKSRYSKAYIIKPIRIISINEYPNIFSLRSDKTLDMILL